MIAFRIFEIMFPVMALIAAGFVFGRWRKIDPRVLAEMVLFLFAPALVFEALARQRFDSGELIRALALSLAIQIIPAAVAWAIRRATGIRHRCFVPSIMMPNAVTIPYPLALLAFGEEGLAQTVLLSVPMVFVIYTLGITLHGGRAAAKAPLGMPALYTAAAGLLVSTLSLPVPGYLMDFAHLTGRGMFPMALFLLGYRLRSIRPADFRFSLFAAALRIGLGFGSAWALSEALGLAGTFRAVLFLVSCSPPAFLNYIFAERFGEEGALCASVVFTGTALSMATTPLVLLYLKLAG